MRDFFFFLMLTQNTWCLLQYHFFNSPHQISALQFSSYYWVWRRGFFTVRPGGWLGMAEWRHRWLGPWRHCWATELTKYSPSCSFLMWETFLIVHAALSWIFVLSAKMILTDIEVKLFNSIVAGKLKPHEVTGKNRNNIGKRHFVMIK